MVSSLAFRGSILQNIRKKGGYQYMGGVYLGGGSVLE